MDSSKSVSETPPESNHDTRGPQDESAFRVIRKRNRVPVSCTPCRIRKLKCNRDRPCLNCVKREGANPPCCVYADPPSRRKHQASASRPTASPGDMLARINRLENLVLTLVNSSQNDERLPIYKKDASSAAASRSRVPRKYKAPRIDVSCMAGSIVTHIEKPPNDCVKDDESIADDDGDLEDDDGRIHPEDTLETALGFLRLDSERGKSMYVGQDHWHAVLADISEVKTFFAAHTRELEKSYDRVRDYKPPSARSTPTLLIGAPPTTDEILRESLPPKEDIDVLQTRFFDIAGLGVGFIHEHTFRDQVEKHFEDPSQTPLMWIGLLYGVLSLAHFSYDAENTEPPKWKGKSLDLGAEYRERTVQCLVRADYPRCKDFTLETLLLYQLIEDTSRHDADVSLLMISSIILRAAFRLGYHRDPKWFPVLSPYEAEMRRRVWITVRASEILYSYKASLPSMFESGLSDVDLPANYLDDDFDVGTVKMPPSRPCIEVTPVSFLVGRYRLSILLASILRLTAWSAAPVPYEAIAQIEKQMVAIQNDFPETLRHKPMACFNPNASPKTIMYLYHLAILNKKTQCMLYRRFMHLGGKQGGLVGRFDRERREAVGAAMEMLRYLDELRHISQTYPKFRILHWQVTRLATQEFTLPSTILMAELHYDQMLSAASPNYKSLWTRIDQMNMLRLVRVAYVTWYDLWIQAVEAYKSCMVVDVMMKKMNLSLWTLDEADPNDSSQYATLSYTPPNDIRRQQLSAGAVPDSYNSTTGSSTTGSTPASDTSSYHDAAASGGASGQGGSGAGYRSSGEHADGGSLRQGAGTENGGSAAASGVGSIADEDWSHLFSELEPSLTGDMAWMMPGYSEGDGASNHYSDMSSHNQVNAGGSGGGGGGGMGGSMPNFNMNNIPLPNTLFSGGNGHNNNDTINNINPGMGVHRVGPSTINFLPGNAAENRNIPQSSMSPLEANLRFAMASNAHATGGNPLSSNNGGMPSYTSPPGANGVDWGRLQPAMNGGIGICPGQGAMGGGLLGSPMPSQKASSPSSNSTPGFPNIIGLPSLSSSTSLSPSLPTPQWNTPPPRGQKSHDAR